MASLHTLPNAKRVGFLCRLPTKMIPLAGVGSGGGWVLFYNPYGKDCLCTGSRGRVHCMLPSGHLQMLLFFGGLMVGYYSTNSSPRSFISVLYTQWQGLWAGPGHMALAQRTVVWVAKRMWLGSSGENPEHRSYCLLKVIFFFYSTIVQILLFSTAWERLCAIEWRRRSDLGDLVSCAGSITNEDVSWHALH